MGRYDTSVRSKFRCFLLHRSVVSTRPKRCTLCVGWVSVIKGGVGVIACVWFGEERENWESKVRRKMTGDGDEKIEMEMGMGLL